MRALTGIATVVAFTWAAAAVAQSPAWPTKPLRFIVGYTPGGTADMLARAVGQKLTEAWGQPVIVENRPGGGTNIATELAARAAPDGHTLFMPTVANVINVTLYPRLGYDLMKDFVHVTNLATVPGIVVCHPSLPARDVKDLMALARARPNDIRHGSTGIGSPHHLAAELFKTMAGVKMIHVPYKGATPALTDIVAGHIEVYFGAMVSTIPHVKSGRLRGLAVTSLRRLDAAPGLPTVDEQGLRGFETGSWFGISLPAGTPREIVSRLQAETLRIIGLADVRDRMVAEGAQFVGSTPVQFEAFLRAEIDKWGRAVRASGARVE